MRNLTVDDLFERSRKHCLALVGQVTRNTPLNQPLGGIVLARVQDAIRNELAANGPVAIEGFVLHSSNGYSSYAGIGCASTLWLRGLIEGFKERILPEVTREFIAAVERERVRRGLMIRDDASGDADRMQNRFTGFY